MTDEMRWTTCLSWLLAESGNGYGYRQTKMPAANSGFPRVHPDPVPLIATLTSFRYRTEVRLDRPIPIMYMHVA